MKATISSVSVRIVYTEIEPYMVYKVYQSRAQDFVDKLFSF